MTGQATTSELVAAYESLSERGRELFRTLVREGPVERPADEIPARLWSEPLVRYEGEVHSVSKTEAGNVAVSDLDVLPVDGSEVTESDIVAYGDLSEEAAAIFEQALTEGRYTVRGETLPEGLREARYVEYDGSTYELQVTVGDIRVWRLSARVVSRDQYSIVVISSTGH